MSSHFSVFFKNLDVLVTYRYQHFSWFHHRSAYAPKL